MFPFWLQRWLDRKAQGRKSRRARRKGGKRPPFNGHFDCLENRWLPATGIGNPTPHLIADINTTTQDANPYGIIGSANGTTFFLANDGRDGTQLWATDGTATNTVLLTSGVSGLGNLAVANNKLFFEATDATNTTRLFESDGTTAGTTVVPGTSTLNSFGGFIPDGNELLFNAYGGGYHLYETDGTTTNLITVSTNSSNYLTVPGNPTNALHPAIPTQGTFWADLNGAVYFSADDGTFPNGTPNGQQLWKWDGTNLAELTAVPSFPSNLQPADLTVSGGELFFVGQDSAQNHQVWVYNPSTSAITQLTASAGMDLRPSNLTDASNGGATPKLLFVQNDPNDSNNPHGFVTNGATTQELTDAGGNSISSPGNLTVLNGELYFTANDSGSAGITVLVASDGTLAGTQAVNLNGASLYYFTALMADPEKGLLFFVDTNGALNAVSGTQVVSSTSTASITFPSTPNYADLHGQALFSARDKTTNQDQVYSSDGTSQGTQPLTTFNPPEGIFSNLSQFTVHNNQMFFTANDGLHGNELWVTNGSPYETGLVADVNSNTNDSVDTNSDLLAANGRTFFLADDGIHGRQLYATDGTPFGTQMLTNGLRNIGDFQNKNMAVAAGKLFFTATDASNQTSLYVSDGTPGGTSVVPGTAGLQDFQAFLPGNNFLLFNAYANSGYPQPAGQWFTATGQNLFWTDGTSTSIVQVPGNTPPPPSPLNPPSSYPNYNSLDLGGLTTIGTSVNGTFYFPARYLGGTSTPTQIWRTDGTTAAPIPNPSNFAGDPSYNNFNEMTGANGKLFTKVRVLNPNTSAFENHLWETDGTTATDLSISAGVNLASSNSPLVDDSTGTTTRLFFFGQDNQLWVSDGTTAGTQRLTTSLNSLGNPLVLMAAHGLVFFTAYGSDGNLHLYESDGTVGGTVLVPGTSGLTQFNSFMATGDQFFFNGSGTAQTVAQLYATDGTTTTQLTSLSPSQQFSGVNMGNWVNDYGELFFIPNASQKILWQSDGTVAGTRQNFTFDNSNQPFSNLLTRNAGAVFFIAGDQAHGVEPWVLGTPAGPAAVVLATSGDGQGTTLGSPYPGPLVVKVVDASYLPVPGVSVTFQAPASGAGGTFSNSLGTITAATDFNGQVSETFTANSMAGNVAVMASVSGVSPAATFSLVNEPVSPQVAVNPINISYGTALANNQLSGTATWTVNGQTTNVPGSFTFRFAFVPGTFLQVGNGQSEQVIFTPSDTNDFNTVQTTVTINVAQVTPQVVVNPVNLPLGQALADTQLSGTATSPVTGGAIPGTFHFTNDAGKQLPAVFGQTEQVTFTPTDTTDFTSVPTTVIVNVGSTVYWTGAFDTNWYQRGNWSIFDPLKGSAPASSYLPGPQDDVVIDLSGLTVNHPFGNDKIRSLTITGQNVTFNLGGGTLDLSGSGGLGTFQADQMGDVVNFGIYSGGGTGLKSADVTSGTTLTTPDLCTVTLDGVQLDGTLNMTGTLGIVNLVDGLTLNGTINVPSGSLYAGNFDNSSLTIGGSGTIQLGGTLQNTGTGTITFGPNLTVQATTANSTIRSNGAALVNQGMLEANTPNSTLTIQADVTNTGNLTVGAGNILSMGTYTQSAGVTTVDGTFYAIQVNLNGGSLNGTGNLNASVTNAATITPGDAPGNLGIYGNYTQTAAGTLNINIADNAHFGELYGIGVATLDGTLKVSLANGFSPAVGTSFYILGFQSRSGDFATRNGLNLGNNLVLIPTYVPGFLMLTVSVFQTTPQVTVNPVNITYGTALNNSQLSGSATINGQPVPGTFAYTSAARTVLQAFSKFEQVTFTPTDTTHYTPVQANVLVNVSQATPQVTVNPVNIPYGTALANTQLSGTATWTVNGQPVNVSGSFAYNNAGAVLGLGGGQTQPVTFNPTDNTDYLPAPATVMVNVAPATPQVTVNSVNITYGTALNNSQLSGSATSNGQAVPGTFAYASPGTVLKAGSGQSVAMTFTPTNTTTYNPVNTQVSVNVAQAKPQVSVNPVNITYGTALNNNQISGTATWTVNGQMVSVLGAFVYANAGNVLTAGNSQSQSVTFTATDSMDYQGVTTNVTVNVAQAAPQVAVNPVNITYGTKLANPQLSGTATWTVGSTTTTVSGTFAYVSPGTLLSPGNGQVQQVSFTPADTTDYSTVQTTVIVNVSRQQTPLVSVQPVNITYGTALKNNQLLGTATSPVTGLAVAGTFTYTSAAGTVLKAGNGQSVAVTFTPKDTTNFTPVATSVIVNVAQAPVKATVNPVSITYGTALANSQLGGSAASNGLAIPGTFAYANPGTVLKAGNGQSIPVTFTPTDATDYATVQTTVTVNVAQATPQVTFNPVVIPYGTPLDNSQLSGTATWTVNGQTVNVQGNYAYNGGIGNVLQGGQYHLGVTFTPVDTTDYKAVNNPQVSVLVGATAPNVHFNDVNIPYGTALANNQVTGTATAVVNGQTVNVNGTYSYTGGVVGTVLPAGNGQLEGVAFTPAATNDYAVFQTQVFVNVAQAAPQVTVNLVSLTYGTALANSQLSGTATWVVKGVQVNVAGTFIYQNAGSVLPAGNGQTQVVTFTPTDKTDYQVVTTSVKVNVAQATPQVAVNPIPLTYGTALANAQLAGTATWTVGGQGVNVSGTYAFNGAAGAVLTAGKYTLSVTFTPTDKTDYKAVVTNVSVTVSQATPQQVTVNPVSITYGTALAQNQLSGTASWTVNGNPVVVGGAFTYTNAAGTVLAAGNGQIEQVTFTPADTTDYLSVPVSVMVNVAKATPRVTVNLVSLTYGTALANSQLSGTATWVVKGVQVNVAGTFTYQNAASVLGAGNGQIQVVTFTPTDTTDYQVVTTNVTVNVAQATPQVTVNPIPLTYGTALANAQLAGTATWTVGGQGVNVSGTYAFNGAAGAVLAAGKYNLSVTFTPTDKTDYKTLATTLTVTVAPATPQVTVNAVNIPYGTPLLNSQLSGTATWTINGQKVTVAGTFAYKTPGIVLPRGSGQIEQVIFTPFDTTDFNTVLGTVIVNVT